MADANPIEHAVEHFEEGYLCSQSVLLAYAEKLEIDPGTAARIAAPFGAGIAYTGNTCGAVTGALMAIGLRYGHDMPDDERSKREMFDKLDAFLAAFEGLHGSVLCRALLGQDVSTDQGLKTAREEDLFDTLCPGYVEDAARLLGEILAQDDGEA